MWVWFRRFAVAYAIGAGLFLTVNAPSEWMRLVGAFGLGVPFVMLMEAVEKNRQVKISVTPGKIELS